jgi:tRNA (mo5U34)-methyltransferase
VTRPPPRREPELSTKQVRRRIAELGSWFHNLNLGGVQTAPDHFLGDYPSVKWRAFADTLPPNLQGQRVLDIGCNAGFYAIEMKRRGAGEVLGIDDDPRYLAQARFAAGYLGLEIEFRQMSVYDVAQLGQRFDLVLFMGVLYHLRHPLLALDLLHDHVVGDLLVVQSMLRGSSGTISLAADYRFEEVEVFDAPEYPRLHFVEQCYAHDPTNWWVPNRSCLEAMLRSAGFRIIGHPEAEIFLCRRADVRDRERPGRTRGI